ncbi:hypothetical protein [Arthrobacter rhombi]|uniref:hypothetical protein n=1 Tax=Arthrobacter rhombi TaxID=71253 RepID=UPI003FD58B6B
MTAEAELAKAWARISRARDNINELGRVLGQYLDQRPAHIMVDIDKHGRGKVFVDRHEPIPIELTIFLGEALHNLRAGLDNYLYAIAIIDSGVNPPPRATALQWPIALTPTEWDRNEKRLRQLSPHLIKALHRIQPFQAENPGWNCLRLLHDLARVDRHRTPHDLAMWLETVKASFNQHAIHDLEVREGPVDDGGVVATFTKVGSEKLSPALLDVNITLDIDVKDLELPPHPETGLPTRPWGSLDTRLRAMCQAAGEYAEGLVEIARNPSLLLGRVS